MPGWRPKRLQSSEGKSCEVSIVRNFGFLLLKLSFEETLKLQETLDAF